MYLKVVGRVKFNYQEVPTLEEYIPFSENVDIEGRIEQFCGTQDIDNYCDENESDQEDEYIVERIVTKNSTIAQINMNF